MADEIKGLPEPKDLDEAKFQIETLVKGLDASQERVGELDGQLKASGNVVGDLQTKLKSELETVADLGKKLDDSGQAIKDLTSQIGTLQENNDAAGKDMAEAANKIAEANGLKESVAILTKERDEALDKLDVTETALAKSEKLNKGSADDRKKQNEVKKAANVKYAFTFGNDPGYASMTLCGIQVKPDKDGVWMITAAQASEAMGHGVEPKRATEAS